MKIIQTLVLLLSLIPLLSRAQQPDNWDNYIISVKGHPVSILVNLGLREVAPVKERPYVVILRTKYADVDEKGFPGEQDRPILEKIENELEAALSRSNGALYAGRFTQRGIREFYYYTVDTVDFSSTCGKVMSAYPSLPWLAKALFDKNWSNYFEVLYPSDAEREKIENRRMIAVLQEKGDDPRKPRRIEHMMGFTTAGNRKSFLQAIEMPGFSIIEMPVEKTGNGDHPFLLVLARDDKPEITQMDRLSIYFGELCRKHSGVYEGWKTHVVK